MAWVIELIRFLNTYTSASISKSTWISGRELRAVAQADYAYAYYINASLSPGRQSTNGKAASTISTRQKISSCYKTTGRTFYKLISLPLLLKSTFHSAEQAAVRVLRLHSVEPVAVRVFSSGPLSNRVYSKFCPGNIRRQHLGWPRRFWREN